jgi:nitrate reductase delta subunit
MTELLQHQELCRDFAVLLSYPDSHVEEHAAACVAHMREINVEAVTSLEKFLNFIEESEFSRVEEAFTGAFDLQALCHPYVGYQLCGESQQRTMFMLKMREIYQQYGFVPGNELPDHLAEMLRFLGSINDQECRLEIIRDGLLPAMEKITLGLESGSHPYVTLLDALQSFLNETASPGTDRFLTDRQKECLS